MIICLMAYCDVLKKIPLPFLPAFLLSVFLTFFSAWTGFHDWDQVDSTTDHLTNATYPAHRKIKV